MTQNIICINWEKCNEYNNIVFNVYECNYKVNKNGLFSGPIRNANIFENNKFGMDYGCIYIGKSRFFIENNFLEFIEELIKKQLLFVRLKNKSLKRIMFIKRNCKIEIDDKQRVIIKDNKNVVKTNKFTIFFSFNGLTFVVSGEGIYFINYILDSKYLNECILKGKSINKYDFEYCENNSYKQLNVDILKNLYINIKDNKAIGRVIIDFPNQSIINKYEWQKELGQANWIIKTSKYQYKGNDLCDDINMLLDKGWCIYYRGKTVKTIKRNGFKCTTNTDWLELKIDYVVDDNIISIIDLLNETSRDNKDYIELSDKEIVFIPQNIKENLETLKNIQTKEKLKAKPYMLNKLRHVFENEKLQIKNLIEYDNISLNLDINKNIKLFQYQKYGVKWLKYLKLNNFNGCLADDMGLGKTLQIISFLSDINIRKKDLKTLIIVPKTLLFNWKLEFDNINPSMIYTIYHGGNRNRDFSNVEIIITTYGVINNEIDFFETINFENCIIDESQLAKNHLTNRYVCLRRINAKTKIALSGTPLENNLDEIYYLMDLLNPGLLGSYKKFKKKYIDINNNKELKEIVAPFILRRTKKQVLNELPPKVEKMIKCDMLFEQRMIYDIIKEKARKDIKEGKYNLNFGKILKDINTLRQICCHPKIVKNSINIINTSDSGKLECLKQLLEYSVKNKNKTLVFSQYTSMLKIIEVWIKSKGYNYSYLDGKSNNREQIIRQYRQQDDNFIFLLSIKVAGIGINLVSANTVIIYDPWWNPAVENQAIDRCYRIGQNKEVKVYRLVTKDSIEEKILDLNKKKMEIFEDILADQNTIKRLNISEIINLLE